MKTFGIIGYGKLGSAIAMKLSELNLSYWICSERPLKQGNDAVIKYKTISEISDIPDVIFITKADAFIEEAAENLAETAGEALSDKIIIHCSGINSPKLLKSCADVGAVTAAAHPYQTFFRYSDEVFKDIPWTVDTNGQYRRVESIIRMFGGRAFDLSKNPDFNKVLYHASAVMASNYMHTITSLAADAAKSSGIEPNDFLPKILKTTLKNIITSMNSNEDLSLTGPIVRADNKTLIKHIDEMKEFPDICKEYCRIGLSTLETAYKRKLVKSDHYISMKKIFEENI